MRSTETGTRVAIGIGVVSLRLSGWTFVQSLDTTPIGTRSRSARCA